MSVVGIDFGSQNCYISVARAGGIETVSNDYSVRYTPSYVSFNPKTRSIGVSGKNQQLTNFKNTIWGFKDLIARSFNEENVQNEINNFPFSVVKGQNDLINIKVNYMNEEQVFTPEQITAMLFTKLKEITESHLKTKVVDCVISVPSYFTDAQRRCLLDASKVAQLNCLRLLNDTAATALAYGIYKQDLPADESKDKPRIVVFVDMGHQSLQACVCSMYKSKIKVLGTVFEPCLGGRNFDKALFEHFAKEFQSKYKIDVFNDKRASLRLVEECTKVKKQMSTNSCKIPLNIDCFMNDLDVSDFIQRSQFEELIQPLLVKVENTLKNLLKETNLKPEDINVVEAVGGSTRVPAIKQIIKNVFGREAFASLNTDEAVSTGCAIQCAILSPTFKVRDIVLADAQPYPITLCWKAMGKDDGYIEIFPKFQEIPYSKVVTFARYETFMIEARYTYPNDIPYNQPVIGYFKIGVPPLKDTTPNNVTTSKIKVKVRLNPSGLFTVSTATLVERTTPASISDNKQSAGGPPSKSEGNVASQEQATTVEDDSSQTQSTNSTSTTGPAAGPENDMETEGGDTNDVHKREESGNGGPQDQNIPEQEQNANPASASGKKASGSSVKNIDLPVEYSVRQASDETLKRMTERELEMIANDKLEKDRADAKNSVEEYVYDMRDKLGEKYADFANENDKTKLSKQLTETEDWLYGEGEDLNKQSYIDRLTALKKMGDPIVNRYNEAQDRQVILQDLGHCLQMVRKALDSYYQEEPKYDHIDVKDMEKVKKCWEEKENWYNTALNKLQNSALDKEPPILTSQILSERKSLESVCSPILNKPKPKVEPPPSSPKENGNGSSSSVPPETDQGTVPQNANNQKSKKNTGATGTGKMDVD